MRVYYASLNRYFSVEDGAFSYVNRIWRRNPYALLLYPRREICSETYAHGGSRPVTAMGA
jgi:hypothetical protein